MTSFLLRYNTRAIERASHLCALWGCSRCHCQDILFLKKQFLVGKSHGSNCAFSKVFGTCFPGPVIHVLMLCDREVTVRAALSARPPGNSVGGCHSPHLSHEEADLQCPPTDKWSSWEASLVLSDSEDSFPHPGCPCFNCINSKMTWLFSAQSSRPFHIPDSSL